MTSILALAQESLAWPDDREIFEPVGAAARLLVEQADRRVARALRDAGAGTVRAGLLLEDSDSTESASPVALLVQFESAQTDTVLRRAHSLAWNFSRAPLLITIEPTLLRAWTCCEPPSSTPTLQEVPGPQLQSFDPSDLLERGLTTLHWASLVSGAFVRQFPERFTRQGRVDFTLMENLRAVRKLLHKGHHLPLAIVHDLLARIIFLQFLMDRRDSQGRAALDAARLRALYAEGILSRAYDSLEGLLGSITDTYALFEYLDRHFNGDLFARRDADEDGSVALARERRQVRSKHLKVLAEFVSGRLRFANDQLSLWRSYSFDTIPLEFVSSVYEEFVSQRDGVIYTPSFLVDFILDTVLPWNGDTWDLRVLDPACGSGIFLVKTFQRLVARWRNANEGKRIDAVTLRQILERNLMGVDADEDAVRIAAFSLHLAMCDEVEPRYLWKQIRFPMLTGQRVLHADFFAEDVVGIRTDQDARSFDLVVGNVPWSKGSLSDSVAAKQWEKNHDWPAFDKNIGPLFLAKALHLTKECGNVALLQPATLLFSDNAPAFRHRLFSSYQPVCIVNFASVRRELFTSATGPACLVSLRSSAPNGQLFPYMSPKPRARDDGVFHVQVDAYDVAMVAPHEAATDDLVWTALAWGSRRHLALLQRLNTGQTLQSLRSLGLVEARNGIVWGRSKRKVLPELKGRLEYPGDRLPEHSLFISADDLAPVRSTEVHYKDQRELMAFTAPQLLIRRSWDSTTGRFQAAMLRVEDAPGAVCSQSFVSVHAPPERQGDLIAAALMVKSRLAVFHHALTSGRMVSERPNLNVTDILALPSPPTDHAIDVDQLCSSDDIDRWVRAAWNLSDVEWALVEDASNIMLPESQSFSTGGARRTAASRRTTLTDMSAYCEYALRVLRKAWSSDGLTATIYEPSSRVDLRVVAFHLAASQAEPIALHAISTRALLDTLSGVARSLRLTSQHSADRASHVRLQRIARLYTSSLKDNMPSALLFKPDELRYWTRTVGLRDADEIVVDALG